MKKFIPYILLVGLIISLYFNINTFRKNQNLESVLDGVSKDIIELRNVLELQLEIINQPFENNFEELLLEKSIEDTLLNKYVKPLTILLENFYQNKDSILYESALQKKDIVISNLNLEIEAFEQERIENAKKMKISIDSIQALLETKKSEILNKEKTIRQGNKSLDSLKSVVAEINGSKDVVLKFKSPSGTDITYFGKVKNGLAHGQGIGLYANGNRYEGEWLEGKKHGKGIYFYPDGERYDGDFTNDKRQGVGKYYWKNGDIYNGQWQNDRRHGQGVIKDRTGKTIGSGIWKEDTIEKSMEVNF
jgi:hypothetical protein